MATAWSGVTLATLVATQLAGQAAEQAIRRKDCRFGAILVSGLTVFAVAVHGYHPYAEDGGLYAAGVKRLLDPALYPQATAFVLEPMRRSLFAPLMAAMVRMSHLGLPAVLLGLHLATVWATLYGGWMLAARCWSAREARAGAVLLLACWLGLPIAGTALLMMDPYVTARSLSTPCMVMMLVGVLDVTSPDAMEDGWVRWRGFGLWVGSFLLAATMHPLMGAYALGASLVLLCLRSERRSVRLWGTAGMCGMACVVAMVLDRFAPAESAEYVRVAMTRSYWFLSQWRWFEWVGLVAPLGILVAGTHISKSRCGAPDFVAKRGAPDFVVDGVEARRAVALMAIAVGVSALVVAMAFARVEGTEHLVARLQPLRMFQVVYVVMALMLGAKMGTLLLRRKGWRWVVAAALLAAPMVAAARAAYADSRSLEISGGVARNPWVQAFVWIRENTPKEALFALDADYINAEGEDAQCFRAIAERSALADYSKDGGEASIAPDLTAEWVREQAAQQGLSPVSDAERMARLRPLGVGWVVLRADAVTGFECPYQNAAVKVCRVR